MTPKPGWSSQPICNKCWWTDYPERVPHRLIDADVEQCVRCGQLTTAGIYVRHYQPGPGYPRWPADDDVTVTVTDEGTHTVTGRADLVAAFLDVVARGAQMPDLPAETKEQQ
jgi:hypothetical protein